HPLRLHRPRAGVGGCRRPGPGAPRRRLRLRHRGPCVRRPLLLVLRRRPGELVHRCLPPARARRARPRPRARGRARRRLRRGDPPPGRSRTPRRRRLHRRRLRGTRPRGRPVLHLRGRQQRHADRLAVRVPRPRARDAPGRRHEMTRPRLLVFNQYYWPGVEATAHLLSELCAALAEEFGVTVVTGRLPQPGGAPGRTMHEGVEIVRVHSTAYDRSALRRRALNYATYLAQSLRAGLAAEKPDVVLCMTDPPIIADVALIVARRFGVPLVVVSQDVFPEIAVELKRLENPAVIEILRRAIGAYLERADRVVAIGETMRERLEQKGAPAERLRVIPNWVDSTVLTPQPRDNEWAREHGLDDRFVVMHSGNVGYAQNLDALVRAATFLRDLDRL